MSPSACNSVRHKKTRHETNNPTNTHRNSPHCNPRTLQTMTNNIQTKHTLPLTSTRAIAHKPAAFHERYTNRPTFQHHSCPRTSRTCACRASAQVCFSRFVVACGHPSKLNDVLGKSRGGLPRSVPAGTGLVSEAVWTQSWPTYSRCARRRTRFAVDRGLARHGYNDADEGRTGDSGDFQTVRSVWPVFCPQTINSGREHHLSSGPRHMAGS